MKQNHEERTAMGILTELQALEGEADELLERLKNDGHDPDVVERIRDIQDTLETHADRLDADVLRRGLELIERSADDLGGLRGPIRPEQRVISVEIDHLRAELEMEYQSTGRQP